jgi:hypothetical protein
MIDTERMQAILQRDLDALEHASMQLRQQISAGEADVTKEWAQLEQRLRTAREEIGRIQVHAKASVQRIERDARELLDDLRTGYACIRERL